MTVDGHPVPRHIARDFERACSALERPRRDRTINIISNANVPASANVTITIIADSTVNFGSSASAGGIKVAPTALTSGKSMTFIYDSATTFWYPLQGG